MQIKAECATVVRHVFVKRIYRQKRTRKTKTSEWD